MSVQTHTDSKSFYVFGVPYPSEREGIIGMMDSIQVAEACAGRAIAAWAEACKIPALRGGLKIIAEREAYHGRVFQQRLRELGSDCRTELDAFSQANEACIYNPGLTDLEKLTEIVERAGDPDMFLGAILDFAESIVDDVESKEAIKLFYADEVSSAYWLRDTCRALTGETEVPQAA